MIYLFLQGQVAFGLCCEGAPMRRETIVIHGGYDGDESMRAAAVPIHQTVAYEFDSADHAAALFDLEAEGYRYSRIANPTNAVLERRLAELEGGVGALTVASGQAALFYTFSNLLDHGGNIVAAPTLYGATHTLLGHVLNKDGAAVRFAESDTPTAMAAAIDGETMALFCESVGNPAGNICDVRALAEVAHAACVPLIVDNTVATPILLRPFEHGADIIVHSLTKFIGGHGTTLGGAIIDSGRFPWDQHKRRFPMFTAPDRSYHGLVYTERFGAQAFLARARSVYQRTTGATLAPLSAFLLMQGLETLALRVERHVDNARKVAEWLKRDSRVAWVNYAGLRDSPYYALSQKYFGGAAPSLLSFGVKGGLHAGKKFYDSLMLVKRVVNIGDAKTLACHPASTTHRQMNPQQLAQAGVRAEMIRLSIGIEHIDDILDDLDQALRQAAAAPTAGAEHEHSLSLL